jgi:conjugal transfer/entry exclusion protein
MDEKQAAKILAIVVTILGIVYSALNNYPITGVSLTGAAFIVSVVIQVLQVVETNLDSQTQQLKAEIEVLKNMLTK